MPGTTSQAADLRNVHILFAVLALLLSASASADTRTIPHETVIARNSDAASRFIEVDGVKLRYKDEGSGPIVLLVHGTFGDLGDWDDWTRSLAEHYRVIRVDLPGFGLSGPIASGNYSVDRMLSLVDGLMDLLDAPRFALVGVSYGGLVAFRYAATRTDRVSALVLINSAGIEYGSTRTDDSGPKPPPDLLTADTIERKDVESLLAYLVGDPARITPALVDRKLDYVNAAGRQEESILGRKLYERGDPARVLAHIRAPVLVLWGGKNRVLKTDTASTFMALLKGACFREQIVYSQGAHLLNLQIPAETVADAKRFFDAQVAPDASSRCSPSAATR